MIGECYQRPQRLPEVGRLHSELENPFLHVFSVPDTSLAQHRSWSVPRANEWTSSLEKPGDTRTRKWQQREKEGHQGKGDKPWQLLPLFREQKLSLTCFSWTRTSKRKTPFLEIGLFKIIYKRGWEIFLIFFIVTPEVNSPSGHIAFHHDHCPPLFGENNHLTSISPTMKFYNVIFLGVFNDTMFNSCERCSQLHVLWIFCSREELDSEAKSLIEFLS